MRPTALVTGSAIRLGRAIALALADAGYDIALHYNRSADKALVTAEEVRARGVHCEALAFDLNRGEGFEAYMADVKSEFPGLSVLVNSASGYTAAPIMETTVEEYDALMNVNLRAPFFMTKAFAAAVETGSVINIIDNKVGFHQYDYAAYLLSKKTLAEFTHMAAMELAPRIRVNGVSPGVVMPATRRSDEYVAWRVQGIPLQKQGSADHITDAVKFLLGNHFVTGQIITVDGGENIQHIGRNATSFAPGSDKPPQS